MWHNRRKLLISVLTTKDLEFFHENGYVIARQVISREQAEDAARDLRAFAGTAAMASRT